MAKRGAEYIGSREQRFVDSSLAVLLGTTALLPFGAAAAAMAYQQRTMNILLRQQRVKESGNPDEYFEILKLRTIAGDDYSNLIETGGCLHPRATKLAKFIRATGFDEVPQLLGVLKGELNLFGIRPQTDLTLEQRQSANPHLFEDWYSCYLINKGVFGSGQNIAHILGQYREDGPDITQIMLADIRDTDNTSTAYNLRLLVGTPVGLLASAVKFGLQKNTDQETVY